MEARGRRRRARWALAGLRPGCRRCCLGPRRRGGWRLDLLRLAAVGLGRADPAIGGRQ
jgi:hypothetical protein